MAIVKVKAGKGRISDVFNYVLDKEKTDDTLISGHNCMAETAQREFEMTKYRYGKTDGRTYLDSDEGKRDWQEWQARRKQGAQSTDSKEITE